MLSYEEFKEKLVTEVTVYAPEKYKNAIVDIMGVPKAEGNVDAIIMRMPDTSKITLSNHGKGKEWIRTKMKRRDRQN